MKEIELVENDFNVTKSKSYLAVSETSSNNLYEEDYSLKAEEFNYLEMFPEYNGD